MNLFFYYLFDFRHIPKKKGSFRVNSMRIKLINQSLAYSNSNSSLYMKDSMSSHSVYSKSDISKEEVKMDEVMMKELLEVF